jgi:nitrogen regulatory protein P-II 1
MFVVMYVSKTVGQARRIVEIWLEAGIEGITILDSAGMHRASKPGIRDDVGLVFSLEILRQAQEIHHRTVFSVVGDEATVDRIVKATTDYVGDWSSLDVGILFVWPLTQVYGLNKKPS